MKIKKLLYLLPYFSILVLGIWYRMQGSSVAFLDGDSGNYLLPPFVKKLAGEWHKGERPMAYLQFIYYTLSSDNELNYTIFWQQVFSLTGGAFLAGTWVITVNRLKRPEFLLHAAGYVLLLLYVSCPQLMFYERFIGPEAISIALMGVLILCLTFIFNSNNTGGVVPLILSGTVFLNLYLGAYLNKWIFASVFLELLLIYLLLKKTESLRKSKFLLLALPHLFYFALVTIPEKINKIDSPFDNRLYISQKQMVYTHFDILLKDKSNFDVPVALQDSLVQYFSEAQKAQPDFLIGFDCDVLMWGKANDSINSYFKNDYNALNKFYQNLNWILATKYPIALSGAIAKQAAAFFIPNPWIHNELYSITVLSSLYQLSVHIAGEFDRDIVYHAEPYRYAQKNSVPSEAEVKSDYTLGHNYPPTMEEAGIMDTDKLPMLFDRYSFVLKWFDYFFLLAMLLFFAMKTYRKELFKPDVNTLLYGLIIIYVFTVGIVHTFDIGRFIFTIYPFLLMTTFMSWAYLCTCLRELNTKK